MFGAVRGFINSIYLKIVEKNQPSSSLTVQPEKMWVVEYEDGLHYWKKNLEYSKDPTQDLLLLSFESVARSRKPNQLDVVFENIKKEIPQNLMNYRQIKEYDEDAISVIMEEIFPDNQDEDYKVDILRSERKRRYRKGVRHYDDPIPDKMVRLTPGVEEN